MAKPRLTQEAVGFWGLQLEASAAHWRSTLLAEAPLNVQLVVISRGLPTWPLPFRYRKLPTLAPNPYTWAQEDQESFEANYVRLLAGLGIERVLADLGRISSQHGGKPLCLVSLEP